MIPQNIHIRGIRHICTSIFISSAIDSLWKVDKVKNWKQRKRAVPLASLWYSSIREKSHYPSHCFLHSEANCNAVIKGSTMLFRDKHGVVCFCFALLVPPGPPCQSPTPELLSAVIDIFKTAALETGTLANTGSRFCNFQYLVMRCFLCIGYFTLTAATSTTMDLVNMVKVIIQHESWFSIKSIPNSFLFIRRINHGQVLEWV